MTKLIQRMREELVRRNYAETTIRSYLQTMEEFRRFAHKRLDHLGPDASVITSKPAIRYHFKTGQWK